MSTVDNGGAYAIKGFNYQKSVIVLVAVQNYLKTKDFEIYIETNDDIVVKGGGNVTYIQVKSNQLSIKNITLRPKGKSSILEKSLANGDDNSFYKIVTPTFKNLDDDLEQVQAKLLTKGATVYRYSDVSVEIMQKRIASLSKNKLKNSRIALTAFQAQQQDAQHFITGVMVAEGIMVDNNHGLASLKEMVNEIDFKSEILVKNEADAEKKKFTAADLLIIFSHTDKMMHFEKIVDKLGYTEYKKMELTKNRLKIGALYDAIHGDALVYIKGLDLNKLTEAEVIKLALGTLNFDTVESDLMKETIVLDALSQIIFEGSRA